jgi:hypothetical protein
MVSNLSKTQVSYEMIKILKKHFAPDVQIVVCKVHGAEINQAHHNPTHYGILKTNMRRAASALWGQS